MRTVIIGDIHGCHRELCELLEKAALSVGYDRLILLGDYIDKGSDSFEVLSEVKKLKQSMKARCVALRGNHEQLMLDFLADHTRKRLWDLKGAQETIRSFKHHRVRPQDYEEWILEMPLYHETDEYIAAHAAVSIFGPAGSDMYTLLFDHNLTRSGTYRGKLLINGHTHMGHAVYQDGAGQAVELSDDGRTYIMPAAGNICIDTGCVYGGKLTALIAENGGFSLVSVSARQKK